MSISYINCPYCLHQFPFNDNNLNSVPVLTCPMCGQIFAFSIDPLPSVQLDPSVLDTSSYVEPSETVESSES